MCVQAIDVWMSTCLVFVFGALLEYCFVNVLARKIKQKIHSQKAETAEENVTETGSSRGRRDADENSRNRAVSLWGI